MGKGEELPGDRAGGSQGQGSEAGPDHLPAEPRPPHTGSPAPTAPAALATSFNNTVWHLIGS